MFYNTHFNNAYEVKIRNFFRCKLIIVYRAFTKLLLRDKTGFISLLLICYKPP